MKGTTREYLAVLVTYSLLFMNAHQLLGGCDPPCDDCEDCDIEDCECVWEGCPPCGRCRYCDSNCDCQWRGNCRYDHQCPDCYTCPTPSCNCTYDCNPSTQFCCDGTCCNNGTTCCDGACCDPDNCMECDGQGNCVSRCADCMICVAGDCVDIQCAILGECEECNETTGVCDYICSSEECCHNNICIDKCNPNGGATCTWTNPPVLDPLCTWIHDTNHGCLHPGDSCSWEVIEGSGKNATCADCAPGCTTSTYCVKLKPIVCEDVITWLPPWKDCTCTGTPDLWNPEEVGTRDVCP